MFETDVLKNNHQEVNRILLKTIVGGTSLFFALCYVFLVSGTLAFISLAQYLTMLGSNAALILGMVVLYKLGRARALYPFLLPGLMYVICALNSYLLQFPLASYLVMLLPVIYAAMYAHLGAMSVISALVLVTVPIEVLLSQGTSDAVLSELVACLIVLVLLVLRLLTVVRRTRTLLRRTGDEAVKNLALQQENLAMMSEIAVTIEEVGQVVEQVNHMSATACTAMSQVGTGSTAIRNASLDAQAVLRATEERTGALVARTHHIEAVTQTMVAQADRAQVQAMAGEQVVHQVGALMAQIDADSQATAVKAEQLAERAHMINSISALISKVAKDVHVVAINTGIEAARAGAQGKSFQIIAREVQALAGATSQAAKQISELSLLMNADIRAINQGMLENRTIVQTGVAISDEAREKLLTITQVIQDMNELIVQIAHDSAELRHTVAYIATGTETLTEQTACNLTNMETTAQSAQQTMLLMEDLSGTMNRLRERMDVTMEMCREIKV